MRGVDYYSVVAGRFILAGLREEEVRSYANYKEGKTFADLQEAVSRGLEGIDDEFGPRVSSVAEEIRKVIRVDSNKFDEIYGEDF